MRLTSTVFENGEAIDSEIEEAAHVIAQAVGDDVRSHLDTVRRRVLSGGAVAVGGVVVGVALLGFGSVTLGLLLAAVGVVAGGGYAGYALRTEPEVQVTNVEKRYWTAHLLPQQDGVFVYDATASLPATEFELEQIDGAGLEATIDRIGTDRELPVVRTPENDPEAEIRDGLRSVKETLSDTETTRITASVVDEGEAVVEGVKAAAAAGVEDHRPTDSMAVPLEEAEETADRIEGLETLAFETDPAETFDELEADSEAAVETIATTTEESIERLNDHIDTAGELLALVSYNFYCPDCIEDEIYSELDPGTGEGTQWFCDTCRGEFTVEDDPVPKHVVKDDLVEDIWDRLWIEKDDQRREVYENIEDQKAELKEREFEQRQEEIRNTWNRIKDVRSKIRDLQTEARAERGAVAEIGQVMEKYDRLAAERRKQFERDVEAAFETIDREVDAAIEEMRNYEQEKIDESQEEAEKRAEIARTEERLRQQERVAATEEERQEAREKRERVETLRETEGELHSFDVINDFRYRKAKVREKIPGAGNGTSGG